MRRPMEKVWSRTKVSDDCLEKNPITINKEAAKRIIERDMNANEYLDRKKWSILNEFLLFM